MNVDLNTALIALMTVLVVIQHLRRTNCEQRIDLAVREARKVEQNHSRRIQEQSYEVWKEANAKGGKSASDPS